MNIQIPVKFTAAETRLMDAWSDLIGQLPGDAAVVTARGKLMAAFKAEGLPTRRREAWHYTDLKSLIKSVPAQETQSVSLLAPLVAGAHVLPVINGVAGMVAVDGVTVTPFRSMLEDGSAAEGLNEFDRDDTVGRLNGGFVADGFALSFPDGFDAATPIELQAVHSGGLFASRFPVTFGAGAKATVIERHQSVNSAAAFVSSVSDIVLGEGADVIWVIFQSQGVDDTHLGQIRVKLAKDAKLKLYVINAGAKLSRQDIVIDVKGEGADLMLRGINLLGGESHTDVTLVLVHDAENTTSTETIRNIVFDKAKGVFQGQIKVAQGAQKTDAKMACNTLLLSDEAEFSTKPELEIFADDVVCGHGATVADIDHRHLFYLQSRGIPEARARALLVQAFVQEVVEELEDEALIEALEGVIEAWLENRG